jgi:hypothetical protein
MIAQSRPRTLASDGQPDIPIVEPRLERAAVAHLVARGQRMANVAGYSAERHEAMIQDLDDCLLMGSASSAPDG